MGFSKFMYCPIDLSWVFPTLTVLKHILLPLSIVHGPYHHPSTIVHCPWSMPSSFYHCRMENWYWWVSDKPLGSNPKKPSMCTDRLINHGIFQVHVLSDWFIMGLSNIDCSPTIVHCPAHPSSSSSENELINCSQSGHHHNSPMMQ